MDEDEKKHLLSALRATVTSQKGGVELRVLNSDFQELEGENIPFRKLGFSTLQAYIRSLSNDFSLVPKQGSLYVVAKKSEALAHLQDMISGQAAKKKSTKKSYKSSRGKFAGYNTSFNNRSSQHKSYPRSTSHSNRFSSSKPSNYNNSKPRATRASVYQDWDQDDDGYVPAVSPERRKSPPRERYKPASSAFRNREPATNPVVQPAQKKREPPAQKAPPNIKKMPEPRQPSQPSSQPSHSSQPLPRLLTELAKDEQFNKAKDSQMLNLQITLSNDYYVPQPAQVEEPITELAPPLDPQPHPYYPPSPSSSPSLVEYSEFLPVYSEPLPDAPPDDLPVPSMSLKSLLKKLQPESADTFVANTPASYDSSVAPDSYSSFVPDTSFVPDSYNSFVPDSFNPNDTSTLVKHLESLQLRDSPPTNMTTTSPGTLQAPDMVYLKSLLAKLQKESALAEEQSPPPAAILAKPEPPAPSMHYLKSLLHKLKNSPRTESDDQSPYYEETYPGDTQLPEYASALPVSERAPFYPAQLPVADSHLTDPRAPFEGTTHTFATDRTQSAFQPYVGDSLDQEVLITTQRFQQPFAMMSPHSALHHFTSPPPISPGYQSSLPSSIAPSLPSPSLLNGASSSSKSSSPEVYIDLPPGASPEQQLSNLCRYLFNEEPNVQIKQLQTDPNLKRKVFTFYAFIQVGSHPRISTLPNDYPSREAAHSAVIQMALSQLTKLKDEKMAKALKKTTDKLNLVIDRIYSLVRNASNGLVATKVEEMYEEKYGEILPAEWTQLPEVMNHPRLEVNSTPISTIVYAKTLKSEHSASAPLPSLALPNENQWPVFLSLMTSVSTVYVRLVDDSCEAFYKMSDELDAFMSDPASKPDPVTEAGVGGLYCLHDDECWHRVRVLALRDSGTVLVRFIDHGEESEHALEELYPLFDMFRTMPAQAIELLLPECQGFAELFDHHLVESEVVGRPLVAVVERDESTPEATEPPFSATLYNTEQEPNLNINHFVFQQICGLFNVSSLPEENMFKESVFVSYISSRESCVYVQVESLMFQYLQSSIKQLVASDDTLNRHRARLAASLANCRDEVFLARYDLDEEYYRARLISVDPIGNKVSVLFIDYGNTSEVSCDNLIMLFETPHHSHLCLIPPQAKQVKLAGLEVFTPEVMEKLTTLLNGTEPVILKMSAGRAQIHKRDSRGKIVGINNLVLASNGYKDSPVRNVPSKELDASPLGPPVIPPLNTVIDVLVETISSPTNFWIRVEESYNEWVELMEEMDAYYSENEASLSSISSEDVRVGACFVCPYEELDLWQRVTIHSRISSDCVALFLTDLGKIITADTSSLRYLAPQFRKLPAIAIKAKLHNIEPAFVDWTPADIVRFQALCEGGCKVFKCRVESASPDVMTHGGEHVVLSVRLLDSHGPKDIDLASCLVVEGRAKMTE